MDLLVFTRIAGTSQTRCTRYWCKYYIEKHAICHKDYRLQSFLRTQYVHSYLCKHLGIDSSTDRMIGIRSVLKSISKSHPIPGMQHFFSITDQKQPNTSRAGMDCGKLTLFLLLQTLKRGVACQDFAEKHSVPTFMFRHK